jgi:hypothetical protein
MNYTPESEEELLRDEIAELEDEVQLLKKEIAHLKWKYEERCWCSANVPATCGHHK